MLSKANSHSKDTYTVRFSGFGHYVPKSIVSNQELATPGNDVNPDWTERVLGVRNRRVVAEGQQVSDMATEAALMALSSAGINKEDLDAVIVATATPDAKAPSVAALVTRNLGIESNTLFFDVSAVCNGFLLGVSIAHRFIASGTYEKILVIGADAFSQITDYESRDCVYFGDGAGAAIIERSSENTSHFCCELSGNMQSLEAFKMDDENKFFKMIGNLVSGTAKKELPPLISSFLQQHEISIDSIDHVVPHQSSKYLVELLSGAIGIEKERFVTFIDEYANTAGASVPLTLSRAANEGRFKRGDRILLFSIGSGMTWGCAYYIWH